MIAKENNINQQNNPRIIILLLILVSALLHLWGLDRNGLSYDEAATALMAQAPPLEIIDFHWRAAFEHPPLWQLTMHLWSNLFGQSEFALRLLSAMAGILALPLLWSIQRVLWPTDQALHWLTALLFITSPSLLLYGQEARMYPIMLCLALLSLYCCTKLPTDKRLSIRIAFILCNWLMVGYHYYSALLIMAQALFLFTILLRSDFWKKFLGTLLIPITLSILPGALWVGFSPGFQATFSAVASGAEGLVWQRYLDQLWRELIFGNVRWLPEQSWYSYLLLPLFCLGMGAMIWDAIRHNKNRYGAWLFCLTLIIPILFSIIGFQKVKIRYLIYIAPVVYTALAYGLLWLARRTYKYPLAQIIGRSFFLTNLVFTGLITANALDHYFQKYQKSAYREMATYLQNHLEPTDGILLEAPRQHLLTKYYLGDSHAIYPVPEVQLPSYWPINAPRVIPEESDGHLQNYLHQHPSLWLSLTAEVEVDPGEFVPKYLSAVAYPVDCEEWLDVRLCHYLSPHFVEHQFSQPVEIRFGNELILQEIRLGTTSRSSDDRQLLIADLTWHVEQRPTIDYKITLRLRNKSGDDIAQRDDYPIGPLLPPTTWNPGDTKPGYRTLPLPAEGHYQLVIGAYDPATGAPISTGTHDELLILSQVEIDGANVKFSSHQP